MEHIAGDIINPSTWGNIVDWTERNAARGLALVMHRPMGALQELPSSTYKGAAHFILDMIRPDGLMFTQIPRILKEEQPRDLIDICTSIKGRSDVAEVIYSSPRPDYLDLDPDTFAAILKK